jgi:asparaginyl-tRNA synthetase
MNNDALDVRSVLAGKAPKDTAITIKGRVRTRCASKAGISFIHVSAGSSFHPIQVVAQNTLSNYVDILSTSYIIPQYRRQAERS